jgi:hypothetical protein
LILIINLVTLSCPHLIFNILWTLKYVNGQAFLKI